MTSQPPCPVLQVEFDCPICKLQGCKITVAARTVRQGFIPWVESVKPVVALYHRTRSPRCPNVSLNIRFPCSSIDTMATLGMAAKPDNGT